MKSRYINVLYDNEAEGSWWRHLLVAGGSARRRNFMVGCERIFRDTLWRKSMQLSVWWQIS